MRLVNLGCGNHYHPDWINIDIAPAGPEVIAHDLSKGIPLESNSCDAAYHSHVLEHIRRAEALQFTKECYRVLKPGGVLRIVVPDLERICRLYVEKLDGALAGDPDAGHDYNWIMLEMYDQTVREKSGGAMSSYLRTSPLPNKEFIYERIGSFGKRMVESMNAPKQGAAGAAQSVKKPAGDRGRAALRKVRGMFLKALLNKDEQQALDIGKLRLSGELHQWMYDRYSLARLMMEVGFVEPTVQTATESLIPGWKDFHLDTLPDGSVIKPDSLFMEAVKPGRS